MKPAPIQGPVLVVDDHDDGRLVLIELLELHGYRCVAAATGAQALEVFAAERPSAVVIDLGLPDLDGSEVVARLRPRAAVGIIAYTGYVDAARHARARRAGCDLVLVKPAAAEALLHALRAVLEGRARRARSPGRRR